MKQFSFSHQVNSASRRGVSLPELLISISIAGLIAAGIQSSIFVALKSMPNSQGSAQTTIAASRIMDRLVTDLESAIYVTEHTATTLGFTVPDRTGDGVPERIRYSWTGTAGGPLTYQYNGSTPVTLASSVNLFSLTTQSKAVLETYPAVAAEDATETLLVDYAASTAGGADVTSTAWYGQYFSVTLPANAYAWRPSRLQLYARKSTIPANTSVQIRPVTASLTPTSTVIESQSLLDTNLFTMYSWKSFTLSQTDPLASGNAICCVLQQTSGSPSMRVGTLAGSPGLLQTVNSGSTWSYDSANAACSQLYGKLIRSSGTLSLNSNYLLSMGISLKIAASASTVQTTGAALNHPELLSGLWELKFDRSPTAVDVNGDGQFDWSVVGGGNFDTSTLSNGRWTTSSTFLQTAPNSDFAKTTIVDLRMQNTAVGGQGATFSFNPLRAGTTCAPVFVRLALQSDGTQTLTLLKSLNDSTTQTLTTIAGLAAQPTDVHLVIEPTTTSVNISVNGVQRGTYALNRFEASDSSRVAKIGANGSQCRFTYARIRVLE